MELLPYNIGVDKNFGKTLTLLMGERSFSIQDLAVMTGLSRATVYRHIKSNTLPSATDRQRYAQAFGMTLLELDRLWQGDVLLATNYDELLAQSLERLQAGIEALERQVTPGEREPYVDVLERLKARLKYLPALLRKQPAADLEPDTTPADDSPSETEMAINTLKQNAKLHKAKSVPGIRTGTDLAHAPKEAASMSAKARKKADRKNKPS
jgi:AcrR family transcriptional regulator